MLSDGCARALGLPPGAGARRSGATGTWPWRASPARRRRTPTTSATRSRSRTRASRPAGMHYDEARKHLAAADLEQGGGGAGDRRQLRPRQQVRLRRPAPSCARPDPHARRRAAPAGRVRHAKARGAGGAPCPCPCSRRAARRPSPSSSGTRAWRRCSRRWASWPGVNVLFDEGFRDKKRERRTCAASPSRRRSTSSPSSTGSSTRCSTRTRSSSCRSPQAKRRAYDDVLLRTFYLQNAETKDVETLVKTAVGTRPSVVSNPTLGRHHRLGTAGPARPRPSASWSLTTRRAAR